MNSEERFFSELRLLRKQLDGVLKFVEETQLPQAMSYRRAAKALDIGLTELKEMVKIGMLSTVRYAPGKHPRIPLSEIRRLTSLTPRQVEKPRTKPSRRKAPESTEMDDATLDAELKKRR